MLRSDDTALQLMRDGGQSLHHQISAVLRSQILAGRYAEKAFVPGETALMETFGVSRATVRRALQTLEGEDLIARRQGRGTQVIYRHPPARPDAVEQHINRIERNARQSSVRLLSFGWEQVPVGVQTMLAPDDNREVLKIVRLRHNDGLPLRYIVNHVPPELGSRMNPEQFDHMTLVKILADLGRPVKRFDDEIGATLADPALARALDVRIGAPLVEVSRIMFDAKRKPIAHQATFIPPDRGKLRTSVESGE